MSNGDGGGFVDHDEIHILSDSLGGWILVPPGSPGAVRYVRGDLVDQLVSPATWRKEEDS